jgi:hypothetical protein
MDVLLLEDFLNQAQILEKVSIDKSLIAKIPQPNLLTWVSSGLQDGDKSDDVINAKKVSTPTNKLKPSQSEIFLGKSLNTAMAGLGNGGYLGAIVSSDYRILDGHHRWAATMLNNPTAKIQSWQVDMKISDLIIVLRRIGELFGYFSKSKHDMSGTYRKGQGAPTDTNDINLYDATEQDVIDIIYNGKYINPSQYNIGMAQNWVESIGGIEVAIDRFKVLQSTLPPSDAPPRILMPVIRGSNQVEIPLSITSDGENKVLSFAKKDSEENLAAYLLSKGMVDLAPPYSGKWVPK